ncbi:MAG: Nif3-like dinuclear metal center hexameric protein [Methylococcaceae bacterium]|nr:Nif3-like dinuclear metal center hexameric protein [Methylococcaceae bacterium]
MNGINQLDRSSLSAFLDSWLEPERFADYGPNGLQVEGTVTISRVAFAVSATRDSVERAVAGGAQALVVHHGLLWRFHGARPLTGPYARRLFPLVANGINLYGYHLPLDAHPEIGNAACLGRRIGLAAFEPFGDYQGSATGVKGRLPQPAIPSELQRRLQQVLDHPVLLAEPPAARPIVTVGIITGGANGDWSRAVREGLDAYITGEMSEHDWHEAAEAGICMFAGGHHATERFGIQALMEQVRLELGLDCWYIDSPNPA